MGDKTKIQWTEATWNPLRGCSRVSDGCRHCYAEAVAHRFSGAGHPYEGLTTSKGRWTGEVRFIREKLDEPLRWRKPRLVFVNSMSDLFHEEVPEEVIDQIWAVMLLSPRHVFQCLTKRPERMRAYLTAPGLYDRVLRAADAIRRERPRLDLVGISDPATFPATWIWLGVSVEDQRTADERIPPLLETPAAVRWVSYEPALGPVDFRRWLPGLDWVVAGGEGRGARHCDVAWLRNVVEQCRDAGVACFVKQLGARPVWCSACGGAGAYFAPNLGVEECAECGGDGSTFHAPGEWSPKDRLHHPKGGDPAEWPESLRVREFPR